MAAIGVQARHAGADGQDVWSCPLDAGVNPRVKSPGGRRLTSPTLRGERGAAVKPLRRECRSDFGVPVLACVRLFCFARKAVGASCTRHSLRPRFLGDENDAKPGRDRAAGMWSRVLHCRPRFSTQSRARGTRAEEGTAPLDIR
jgi:hypothetical protein